MWLCFYSTIICGTVCNDLFHVFIERCPHHTEYSWDDRGFTRGPPRNSTSFDGLALSSTNTTWSPRMTYSNCSRIWTYFCIYWNVKLVLIVGHIKYYDSHILYQSLNRLKNWKWQLTRSLMNILRKMAWSSLWSQHLAHAFNGREGIKS